MITKVRAIRLRLAESFRIRLELDRIFPELFQANPRKELVYVGSSKGKDKAFEKPNLVSRAE